MKEKQKQDIKKISLTLALFLFVIFSLVSQDNSKEYNVIVITHSSNKVLDETLKIKINTIISNVLKESEFKVIIVEEFTKKSELKEIAQWMNANYIIESEMKVNNGPILWDLTCYSIKNDVILESYKHVVDLDLTKIDSVERSILDLIELMRHNEITSSEAQLTIEKTEKPKIEKVSRITNFVFEGGFSPFIAAGDVTQYFTIGMQASIFTGYHLFDFTNSTLTIGIDLLFNEFQAKGVLISSENYLFSMGPALRWELTINRILDLYVRFSPGLSLFLVNANGSGFRSTIFPYISLGMGTYFNFNDHFGLSVFVGYSLFFEQSILINGFTPGIGMHIRV